MTLTNYYWMSIPKVNHNDNKAWAHPFFLIDMKVTAKIPWPQVDRLVIK
jgi:hypothetical protein